MAIQAVRATTGRRRCEGREGEFYPSRALCASASTSSVDIAVMSWAVANGLLRVKLIFYTSCRGTTPKLLIILDQMIRNRKSVAPRFL